MYGLSELTRCHSSNTKIKISVQMKLGHAELLPNGNKEPLRVGTS